jgi:hypothetical protein
MSEEPHLHIPPGVMMDSERMREMKSQARGEFGQCKHRVVLYRHEHTWLHDRRGLH